jgi:hypothetical protein
MEMPSLRTHTFRSSPSRIASLYGASPADGLRLIQEFRDRQTYQRRTGCHYQQWYKQKKAMNKTFISEHDIAENLRLEENNEDLDSIKDCYLERSGKLSFIKKSMK